ncbi:MAG: UDP-N-acetylmuramoyl-L-alanyl-D-glutamate--2,6-diaminopimelate ligase [Thalassolituus sp.]
MKLSAIVKDSIYVPPEWDRDVNDIHADSRDVNNGDLFIARAGSAAHGAAYIARAIEAGASVIIEEGADCFRCEAGGVPVYPAENIKTKLPQWLANRYSSVAEMTLYAVTGTNGKSSVTQFIAQLANALGKQCGVVGTLGNGIWPELQATRNTTPDICVVYRMLNEFAEAGADAAALEVSSHGLDQGRVAGLNFDVAVLTNLTQDHLDYHGDMESYFAAKAALFTTGVAKAAVICTDDSYGQRLQAMSGVPANCFSLAAARTEEQIGNQADISYRNIELTDQGLTAELNTPWGSSNLTVPLMGDFNIANVAAAISALSLMGLSFNKLVAAAGNLQSVEGRMALYTCEGKAKAVVDFAHTPDALENVIRALNSQTEELSVVFGCGGDRDRTKRSLMADAAGGAKNIWVADDNPRTESADQIFADIQQSSVASRFIFEHDRAVAITAAVAATPSDGVVLVAGKGHENYQEINGVKHSYSDAAVLESLGYRRAGGGHVA